MYTYTKIIYISVFKSSGMAPLEKKRKKPDVCPHFNE